MHEMISSVQIGCKSTYGDLAPAVASAFLFVFLLSETIATGYYQILIGSSTIIISRTRLRIWVRFKIQT